MNVSFFFEGQKSTDFFFSVVGSSKIHSFVNSSLSQRLRGHFVTMPARQPKDDIPNADPMQYLIDWRRLFNKKASDNNAPTYHILPNTIVLFNNRLIFNVRESFQKKKSNTRGRTKIKTIESLIAAMREILSNDQILNIENHFEHRLNWAFFEKEFVSKYQGAIKSLIA